MHFLYYVAIKKEVGENRSSEDICNQATSVLNDNNFAGDGGFFSDSKADWFVVGGRWSGHLQEIQLDKFYEKAHKLIMDNKKNKEQNYIIIDDIEANAQKLQDLWESLGGVGINTWGRDQYVRQGTYSDDAMVLNTKLYKLLLPKKGGDDDSEGEVAVINEDGCMEDEMLLKDFLKDKAVINKYYIVVIDYHS